MKQTVWYDICSNELFILHELETSPGWFEVESSYCWQINGRYEFSRTELAKVFAKNPVMFIGDL